MENKKKSKVAKNKTLGNKVSSIDKQFEELNLLSTKLGVAQQMNDLRDQYGNSYFKPEWVMKNVIGLTDAEIAESKNGAK